MQSSVVIMRYKYIMRVMQCQRNINQISNSQETLHSSPVRVVRIWQKINRVIATPYCISIFFSSAEDDLCWYHVWERGHAQHHPLSLRMSTRGTRGLLWRWEMLFFLSFSISISLSLCISLCLSVLSLSLLSLSISISISFSHSLSLSLPSPSHSLENAQYINNSWYQPCQNWYELSYFSWRRYHRKLAWKQWICHDLEPKSIRCYKTYWRLEKA